MTIDEIYNISKFQLSSLKIDWDIGEKPLGRDIWIAIEYLTPPPTSVDVERLFSIAGQIVSDKRNKLNPINAEKILFLRENLCRVNYQYWFLFLNVLWLTSIFGYYMQ